MIPSGISFSILNVDNFTMITPIQLEFLKIKLVNN